MKYADFAGGLGRRIGSYFAAEDTEAKRKPINPELPAGWGTSPRRAPKATSHYFVLLPGAAYAGSFYGRTEREARTAARRWLGVDRLPRGTAVWEGTP